MSLELEDLVYTYPFYHDVDIQKKITAKEEFREVFGIVSEPPPEKGQLFRHQTFFKRLMRQVDEQMLIWQTGVGKACGYITISEYYKHIADSLEELRKVSAQPDTLQPPYKRAYILVKGENLVQDVKNQILCRCTDGDYITQQIIDSKTDKAKKSNITRSISRFYEILTYGEFAKMAFALSDDQARIEFSNCIFVVDEVHNINDDTDGGELKVDPKTGNSYYFKMKKNKKTGQIEEKIVENRWIWDQMFRIFHLVFPRKVILCSATPMTNTPSELASRLNLILPIDRQLPDNIDWNTVGLDVLEPYFRGLISYVRALDTGALPTYRGKVLNASYMVEKEEDGEIVETEVAAQMIVYETVMANKQLKVYDKAVNNPESLRPDTKHPEAFDDLKRQVSNFVFPDGSTGKVGYKKYVISDKNANFYKATPELASYLKDPVKFRSLSAKFFEIIRLCKETPGNCWCYIEYIKGSGAVVLGLSFAYNGFENYNEGSSVFISSGSGASSVCGSGAEDSKNRKIRIAKKRRYALLTSNTSASQQSSILELFNSYENRHGEYIKVVIGSPQSRDGINLANVLQVHLAGPGWNQSGSYQAESRAIRSTSHVDLIEEERQKLREQGKSAQEIANAQVIINIYQHAAVLPEDLDVDLESIDLSRYELSERKDRKIKRIMRMMKQTAVDCQINYQRNVRPKDVDYSAACDYDICQYKCVSRAPKEVDYTSFDVLYSSGIVDAIKEEIRDIFRVVFRLSFEELYEELKYDKKFVDLAVTDLVEQKVPLTSRYGIVSYLREDGSYLFLRYDYPLNVFEKPGAVSLSEYSELLIGTRTRNLEEYNGMLQRESADIFDVDIDRLTLENKILLLESALEKYYISKDESPKIQAILDHFRSNIFIEKEPVAGIEYVTEIKKNRGKGRGRKPKPGSKMKLKDDQNTELGEILSEPSSKVNVFFHNLYSTSKVQTAYSLNVIYKQLEGKIRLRKSNENEWKDAGELEEIVYNKIISEKSKRGKDADIYGNILEDGNFRIVDRTKETDGAVEDKRKKSRGLVCNFWKVPALHDLCWRLQFMPFDISTPDTKSMKTFLNAKKEKVKDLNTFSDEKIKFYYVWYKSGASKAKICSMLLEYFKENDLMEE